MNNNVNRNFIVAVHVREMESQTKGRRKFWKPPSFEDFSTSLPTKKIKLDNDDPQEKCQEIPNEPTEPKAVSELAIHPRKVAEIRNWIKWSSKEKAPILLVTGPPGSGKTTTIKVSANEEGILVKEWINPVDKTEYKSEPIFQNDVFDKCNFSETKQIDKFEEFMFRSSRYKSLFESDDSFIILVEDMPNIFVWRPKLFHLFLEKYKNNGKSPVVFILTDDQNLNLSNNLFPNHIKSRFNITNIKFNPVNHSSLVKNLKALSDLYSSEKVSSQILENIIKHSGGDLRCATNDLLLLLRTNSQILSQGLKKTKKSKRNDVDVDAQPLTKKDLSFDFYQTLGRILYPKLISEKEKLDCENPHRIFLHDVHQIAEGWTGSFLKILHENYLQTFAKLKDVVEGAECFSFCDVLDNVQELEEYKRLICVITLMLKNTEPRKTGFNPLKKSFHMEQENLDCNSEVDEMYGCQLRRRDFILDVNPFLKVLKQESKGISCRWGLEVENECEEYNKDSMEIEEFAD